MSLDLNVLKSFLLENIIFQKTSIEADEPLFSTGFIDSFGTLDLIFFLNTQYGTSLEYYEFVENNVDSLNDIEKLVQSKLLASKL
ncbi:MAG: hypothetical protein ACM3KR_05020 [Deltaproteobacteria bacterium]